VRLPALSHADSTNRKSKSGRLLNSGSNFDCNPRTNNTITYCMAQKPVLRGEVGARARVIRACDQRSETRGVVWADAVVQGAQMSGCWCVVVAVLPRGGCARHRVTLICVGNSSRSLLRVLANRLQSRLLIANYVKLEIDSGQVESGQDLTAIAIAAASRAVLQAYHAAYGLDQKS